MDDALDTGNAVLRMALEADARMLHVTAHHAVGYSHFYRGEFLEARTHAEKGISLFDPETERAIVLTFQFSSTVAMHMFLAESLWMLGYPDLAPGEVEKGLALARELNHIPSKAYALAAGCYFYHYPRDFKWIQETAEDLVRVSQEEGFLLWVPVAMMYHGWALSVQGRAEEGIAEIKEGLALFRSTQTSIILPHVMVMLGEALREAGRAEEALAALEEGIREAVGRNEHHMEPELYRLKGELLLQQRGASLPDEVEESFRKALALSRE